MTTKANQNESATLKICEAVKKDGQPCKFKAKPNSCFCGVHKNYIDTSKPLFTEDIEEKEKLSAKKFIYEDGDYIYYYERGNVKGCSYIIHDAKWSKVPPNEFLKKNVGFNSAIHYKIIKRTKCYITLKWKYGCAINTYGEGNVILEKKYDDFCFYQKNEFKIQTDADGNETCIFSIHPDAEIFLSIGSIPPDAKKFKGG
jgi:hypothetical protein